MCPSCVPFQQKFIIYSIIFTGKSIAPLSLSGAKDGVAGWKFHLDERGVSRYNRLNYEYHADVAQWQSISLVMRRLWVRFPPSAPRRSKLYIVCSDFFQKVRAHSFRCSSFSSRKRSAGLRLDEMGALDWCIFFVNIVQSRQNLRVTTVETVEKACHCEEAQRADVAIRS